MDILKDFENNLIEEFDRKDFHLDNFKINNID